MKRRYLSLSNFALAFVDIVLVIAAMWVAYVVRFRILAGIDNLGTIDYHLWWAVFISPLFVFLYGLLGVTNYGPSATDLTRQLGRTVEATSIAVCLLIVCVFVLRLVDMSRMLLVLFWAFSTLFACMKTIWMRYRMKQLYRRGLAQRLVVLVGSGKNAGIYARDITSHDDSPYRILGSIGPRSVCKDVEHLGGYDVLDAILDELNPAEVVVALDPSERYLLNDLLIECEQSGSRVSIIPDYHEFLSSRSDIIMEGETPVINIEHVPLDNMGLAFLKRSCDIVGSAALIALTSPIMLFAAIGTKISSPGPIIFKQSRVGRNKRVFDMYKFRSMRVNAQQDTAWTTADDPRKTKFGSFMRRFSIDELPQLFNVLRGDMSLVGPRPELPSYVERFKVSVPLYMIRHQVRPGMTGWAQINGLRGDTSIEKRVTYDLYYINNWTLLFDLKVLLLTPTRGVLHNDQEKLK